MKKKSYSVMQQALQMMYNEEGITIGPDNFSNPNIFLSKYVSYFKNYINCGTDKCKIYDRTTNQEINYTHSKIYFTYSKKPNPYGDFFDNGLYMMTDGMLLMSNDAYGAYGIVLTVDLNGPYKKPNAWGHDLFSFNVVDNKIIPMGADESKFPIKNYPNYCQKDGTHTWNGMSCTVKALNKPDYFKKLPR